MTDTVEPVGATLRDLVASIADCRRGRADEVIEIVAKAQRQADIAAIRAYGETVTRSVPGTVAERLRVWRAADAVEAAPLVGSDDRAERPADV